ncbi:substrate-binding domain-containing protein [Microbacterium sp. VKM Ac-2923]|uniref:LacI family DNA-binding transcriptional regulator n=1 Tax=Microbacterium sp. VKM Ac-2923 TaxID=2929476 RepID=UPI001FB1E970|nr:substrate-binding domain-containing protein [Microbacterium sp. VKM Ac-2923]MCJ1708878.1 substrate-binding domain-containing protein [Microbacterium sp. VKM Ac-2923]
MTATPASAGRGWQRPSIYDVARGAGVSHMTVSRVLNDHLNIRESTRSRVLQVMEEMSYTRSGIARALASRRARRIGVLIDGPLRSGPDRTLRALEKSAREAGYAVSTFSLADGAVSRMDSAVMELVTQHVDALCVIAPRESSLGLLRQQTGGLPTIVVAAAADASWHTVGVDQREGARLAVGHLIGIGHRTIAHLAGPMDGFDARERAEGWRETLAAAGVPEGPLVVGDWTSDLGFEFGRSFDPGQTTAVFAANDQTALGVLHGLHSRGIRVPDDISLVGFDDLSDSRHFLPPLTTIRQDFAALGDAALRQIVGAIEGDAAPRHDLIPAELIVRGSTKAP